MLAAVRSTLTVLGQVIELILSFFHALLFFLAHRSLGRGIHQLLNLELRLQFR